MLNLQAAGPGGFRPIQAQPSPAYMVCMGPITSDTESVTVTLARKLQTSDYSVNSNHYALVEWREPNGHGLLHYTT